jgi:hypothetical protein
LPRSDGDEEACQKKTVTTKKPVVKKKRWRRSCGQEDGDEEACGQEKDGRKEEETVVAKSRYVNLWRVVRRSVELCCCVCVPGGRERPSKGWRRDVFCTLGKRNVVQC